MHHGTSARAYVLHVQRDRTPARASAKKSAKSYKIDSDSEGEVEEGYDDFGSEDDKPKPKKKAARAEEVCLQTEVGIGDGDWLLVMRLICCWMFPRPLVIAYPLGAVS